MESNYEEAPEGFVLGLREDTQYRLPRNSVRISLWQLLREERFRAEVDRRRKILEWFSYGTDPHDEGTVIKFERRFKLSAKTYNYAAIKAGGKWYVTGGAESPQRVTWDEFLLWLVGSDNAEPVMQYRVMTAFGALIKYEEEDGT